MTAKEHERSHSHSPECPISCLEGLLSPRAYTPLVQNGLKNIKDVMKLHQKAELDHLRNIGELRIREIETILGSIDTDAKPHPLYLVLKLQVTSDMPLPDKVMSSLARDSISNLLDDLYFDTDDGATVHIDVTNKRWLTE